MGLDMYLSGKKFLFTTEDHPTEDGFPIREKILELGYWRKHPNLHGFIVQEFADGVDECQEIDLGVDEIEIILRAIHEDRLPYTEGFFFGRSYDGTDPERFAKEKNEAITTFAHAKEWLEKQDDGVYKSVVYQASW